MREIGWLCQHTELFGFSLSSFSCFSPWGNIVFLLDLITLDHIPWLSHYQVCCTNFTTDIQVWHISPLQRYNNWDNDSIDLSWNTATRRRNWIQRSPIPFLSFFIDTRVMYPIESYYTPCVFIFFTSISLFRHSNRD